MKRQRRMCPVCVAQAQHATPDLRVLIPDRSKAPRCVISRRITGLAILLVSTVKGDSRVRVRVRVRPDSDDLRRRPDEHDGHVLRLQARLKAVEKEIATLQTKGAATRNEILVS